jgi:hypothetical protein
MPKVDRSELPRHLQTLPIFESLEDYLISELRDSTFRWETAIHEAAHGKFRLQAGAVKLIFLPGRFVYDAEKNQLLTACAGMGSKWPPSIEFIDFKVVARYFVAGYLAEELLTGSADAEKSAAIDKKVFEEDFRRFYPHVTNEEIKWYWDRAVAEVRKDLEDDTTKAEIQELARKFEKWLLEN